MNAIAIVVATASFTFAPHLSNYSTGLVDGVSMKTGRHSLGFSGAVRVNRFVFDFTYDRDPHAVIDVVDYLMQAGVFSRGRGEITAGFALTPFLDLQGGARVESFRVVQMPAEIANNMRFSNRAAIYGVRVHSPSNRPFGLYALFRGYSGRATIDEAAVSRTSPTGGFRFEGGYSIPFGDSRWSFTPAYEYDRMHAESGALRLDTNRFLIQFVYSTRK